ncbi:MAG: M14 family zinc carboxypeptidase [Tenuifilaceae bacterium]
MKFILPFILAIPLNIFSQEIITPLEKNNYSKHSSYKEITEFVNELSKKSNLVAVDSIGKSVEGRNLYAIKFSSSEFGKDKSKIKILFLAQQHGNEQSGKEGSLLLAKELVKLENRYLFDKIDIAIIPSMNPDGSEINKRRNANKVDLNRSHLILTEPELIALHNFFDKFVFEVTMDVHEYHPFSEESEKFGYRRNFDEQIGVNTNINVSKGIRDLGNNDFVSFIKKYFNDRKFTFFVYSPGGPPYDEYVRHSTFDINDGRQSFGIQNTFSFIQEGLNSKNYVIDNIKHRSEGQMTGMRGLIEYAYNNQKAIKKLVETERKKLINPKNNEKVAIQLEHAKEGKTLNMPLLSYHSNKDSVIVINDYRPTVKSIYDVTKPKGYLIPKQQKDLVAWVERHNLIVTPVKKSKKIRIEQYFVSSIDTIDFEGDKVANPTLESKEVQNSISIDDYIFIPTNQLKGNLIVTALEPKSMLGLATYKKFGYLLKDKQQFMILRVTEK